MTVTVTVRHKCTCTSIRTRTCMGIHTVRRDRVQVSRTTRTIRTIRTSTLTYKVQAKVTNSNARMRFALLCRNFAATGDFFGGITQDEEEAEIA